MSTIRNFQLEPKIIENFTGLLSSTIGQSSNSTTPIKESFEVDKRSAKVANKSVGNNPNSNEKIRVGFLLSILLGFPIVWVCLGLFSNSFYQLVKAATFFSNTISPRVYGLIVIGETNLFVRFFALIISGGFFWILIFFISIFLFGKK